jgi:acetyl esterase/lipase
MRLFLLPFLVFTLVLGGCRSDDGEALFAPPPSITLPAPTASPVVLDGTAASFYQDISYGPHAENVFDIFLPASETATGLVIYIHGGGFTGGDKAAIYDAEEGAPAHIQRIVQRGIAFASVNYRLLQEVDTDGVIKPLTDSARALQFMRRYAHSFNIDKEAVVLYGASAGAGTSLWLAFSDEMADPAAVDPVLQESTRVLAAGAIETQGTYDLVRWETDVFNDFGITLAIIAQFGLEQRLFSFNGISSLDDLYTPEGRAYRQRIDLLDLMSVDDPPIFIENSRWPASLPLDVGALLHHPNHGLVLHRQAEQIGLNAVVYLPELGVNDPSGEEIVDFLLRHVGA